MNLAMYIVDAFTAERFKGNPAAVVPLTEWLPESAMQAIAAENNLSETAFLVHQSDGRFHIRWFSPLSEIPFCGHATLASAYVLLNELGSVAPLVFHAKAVGDIVVRCSEDGLIAMRFPNRMPEPVSEPPADLLDGLGAAPTEVWRNGQAYIAVYANADDVRALQPDMAALRQLAPLDVCVTAVGDSEGIDFVSRYFWPANGGFEDPVTGSIHAGLTPLWAARLGRNVLCAMQVSARTGILYCSVDADGITVAGKAVRYLRGVISLDSVANKHTA